MDSYDHDARARDIKEAFITGDPVWKQAGEFMEVGYSNNNHYALRAKGVTLYYNQTEWDAFLAGLNDGEFDLDVLEQQPTV